MTASGQMYLKAVYSIGTLLSRKNRVVKKYIKREEEKEENKEEKTEKSK